MKVFALSTSDNPYNPFDDFENWLIFDHQKGYNSSEYLARIARTSDKLSDEQNNKEIEAAIDEIISLNVPKNRDKNEKLSVDYIKIEKEI